MQNDASTLVDQDPTGDDLGPLAWVLEELKKSLDGATKAMRRFVRDAELARGSDLASLDASHLRIARQQLHQAVGALEMVGFSGPAKVMRVMEALAQKFVQRPEQCSDEAANKMERASFALTEYLEGVLKGKAASPVALFSQYREVAELVETERVHPADLWLIDWTWIDAALNAQITPLPYAPAVRSQLDTLVLRVVKVNDAAAALRMRDLALGLSVAQNALEPRVFWKICAAFFEAVASGLVPSDIYAKRAASRVLQQYATLAKGDPSVSDRLAQDLLFFCSLAYLENPGQAPVLAAVRQAYKLTQNRAVNYDIVHYGRFDPAMLLQARKRISTATETWSALAGGDTNRLKQTTDQFHAVTESMVKMHPESAELARALTRAVEVTVRSGEPPSTPVAMEVATSVLYLEAAYEDLDPNDNQMAERSKRLAGRLDHVSGGGQSEALESWMEELYRRVSDRQTMGSVVDELRANLGEVEKALDQYFRNPDDKLPLHPVPGQLSQMRGVFSVLGLDQASTAMLRLRDSVEKMLVDNLPANSPLFEKLGSSLGAVGFLIDMLGYQRAMAKKVFVWDDEQGEFKPLMGRKSSEMVAPVLPPVAATAAAPTQVLPPDLPSLELFAPTPAVQPVATLAASLEPAVAPASPPALATVPTAAAAPVAAPEPLSDDELEIREIFLEEAAEVVQTGSSAIAALEADPSNLADQTTLRRAFHTLKGSSRMVGLTEFGEAGWSMEQLMNAWLAEQKPANPDLLALTLRAMQGFGLWVQHIAARTDASWSAKSFRAAADTLRLDGRLTQLDFPGSGALAPAAVADEPVAKQVEPAVSELPDAPATPATVIQTFERDSVLAGNEFQSTAIFDFQPSKSPVSAVAPVPNLDLGDFDFAAPTAEPQVAEVVNLQDRPVDFEDFVSTGFTEPEGAISVPVAAAVATVTPLVEEIPSSFAASQAASFDSTGPAPLEESVKVIGPLRIGIPLYNVYLNEADEWSRRLQTELSEWALELHEPLPETSVAFAHSLAGSSATVGFTPLSDIARMLEAAMQHVQLHGHGNAEQAHVFNQAAEEIRRLLHQFAAGFLKEPDTAVLANLEAIVAQEFVPSALDAHDSLDALDDLDFAPAVPAAPAKAVDDLALALAPEVQIAVQHAVPAAPLTNPAEFAKLGGLGSSGGFAQGVAGAAVVFVAPVAAPSTPPVALAVPVATVSATTVPGPAAMLPAATLVVSAARASIGVQNDDIDLVDALDADLFPIFDEEAQELMPQLGSALRQWTARPDNLGARGEALRVLHTLKGSARLAGAMRLGEMTHRMESSIERLGSENIEVSQLEPLLGGFDDLQNTFRRLQQGPEQVFALPEGNLALAGGSAAPEGAASGAIPAAAAAPLSLAAAGLRLPAAAALAPIRQVANQSLRVRAQVLDRLVNQAGEVMITRSRLEARLDQLRASMNDLTGNLERMRNHLRDIEVQAESQMQSRMALAKETSQQFDPLEFDQFTRLQELTRMMAESVNDVATVQRAMQQSVEGTEDDLIAQGRQARELQRDLLRTRMVEFESISERLYGVVRQASKDAGKQVKLDITGGSLEVDRSVLERMAPAFEHLLRNAVAHGIEDTQLRTERGKPASGTISIELHHQANELAVTFADDGGGLDLARIRAKAISGGAAPDANNLSDADAANLIFLPGFSTASTVTEISGRGIGMDVVRTEMNAVGGRIETQTNAGKGTQFRLVLPLTTAVTQVVMLRMGETAVGVPASVVEIVRRVAAADLEKAYTTGSFLQGDTTVPFFWGGSLLQASSHSDEMQGKHLPVAVFKSAGQRVAIHVDEVLGNQEVVVKNLGPQLSRLPGLTGMSVLASGAAVLIYNPVALVSVYGEQARALRRTAANTPTVQVAGVAVQATAPMPSMMQGVSQVPLILVVDDSITVRRVTQRLLKREGYRVALAADGLQALERLQEEKPTVVLSDIEMPRMDGFDLARNIRADAALRDLPIIMITSRIAEKHREHARELGVDHYLGKPYSEDELLRLVNNYCNINAEQ